MMFVTFLGILYTLPIIGWIIFKFRYRKLIAVGRNLPTIEPTRPIIGHLHLMIQNKNFILDVSKKAASQNVNQFCLWLGPYPYIVVQNPEDIQVVLNSQKTLAKGPEYDLQNYVVGDGLLTAAVHIWKPSRRQIQPMFHPRNLESLMPVLNNQGKGLVKSIQDQDFYKSSSPKNEYRDVMPLILPLTIKTLTKFMFGPDSEFVPEPDLIDDVTGCVTRCFQLWARRMFKVWLQSDLIFNTMYKQELKEIATKSGRMAAPALEALRKRLEKGNTRDSSENTDYYTIIDAYTPLAQANPNVFSEKNFEHTICTLCAAVSDTTSITLSSFMLALAWFPDVQEKVYKEIIDVIGHRREDVSTNDLKKLTYMEQVLKETLRLFTVFPVLSRTTSEDIQLSFGVLPAGTTIRVGIEGVHMNPNIYPKPKEFDPERFTFENISKRHKCAHLGFSAGARNCIGKEYAMMSMKTTLVHVIRKHKIFTNAPKLNIKFKFYMEQIRVGGYPLLFEPRE